MRVVKVLLIDSVYPNHPGKMFKYENNAIGLLTIIHCQTCSNTAEIEPDDIPDPYPADKNIIFQCGECGKRAIEDKVRFIVK